MSRRLKIDVHVHLAGTGCCDSGCWISPKFRRRYTFQLLKLIQGISHRQMHSTIDRDWAEKISEMVQASELDGAVVLGFDGVYDSVTGHQDVGRSQMIIPPKWVFEVCKTFPGLLPGPSINPYSRDALKKLEYCIEAGAVLIKWLPAAQGIDPSDVKIDEFYDRVAEAKIPLLIHMGGEKTFHSVAPELINVERLQHPLERGVTVICAHSATRILGTSEPDQTPQLKNLLGRFQNLYLDNSGLCNPSRFAHLPKLAADRQITGRTLHGSDWPVPSNAFYYLNRLGPRRVWEMERIRNPFQRDIEIKRDFGYGEDCLTRPMDVLANLDIWCGARRD